MPAGVLIPSSDRWATHKSVSIRSAKYAPASPGPGTSGRGANSTSSCLWPRLTPQTLDVANEITMGQLYASRSGWIAITTEFALHKQRGLCCSSGLVGTEPSVTVFCGLCHARVSKPERDSQSSAHAIAPDAL